MNVICIGAHPDDAEVHAGGACLKWARAGHRVVLVSLTNGDAGHHEMPRLDLAQRRKAEAEKSAAPAGMESLVLDYHDGEFQPSLEARNDVIRIIRRYRADVVLTHRTNDYHPDHRHAGEVVQDAAFMVMVPHICPDVPALRKNPLFLYMMNRFCKPAPFRPDVVVDVTDVMKEKLDMLDAMESQVYEWLPWLDGRLKDVPADSGERRRWLAEVWTPRFRQATARHRDAVEKWYGSAADDVEFAELFEICEYGHQPTRQELIEVFSFRVGPER